VLIRASLNNPSRTLQPSSIAQNESNYSSDSTNGTAVALTEPPAAFVLFQRQPLGHSPT